MDYFRLRRRHTSAAMPATGQTTQVMDHALVRKMPTVTVTTPSSTTSPTPITISPVAAASGWGSLNEASRSSITGEIMQRTMPRPTSVPFFG